MNNQHVLRPSSVAPGISRLKMARTTMSTFNNNWKRCWWWSRRWRWWLWLWLCVVGSLLLEHTPPAPTTPNTKGKRLGQRACDELVAQGQRGGGRRVLGVFENWAGKCVFDFDLKRPTATLVASEVVGYRKRPPFVRAYAPTRSSKPHPRAPPLDPRLKPGPVFVTSGGVTSTSS